MLSFQMTGYPQLFTFESLIVLGIAVFLIESKQSATLWRTDWSAGDKGGFSKETMRSSLFSGKNPVQALLEVRSSKPRACGPCCLSDRHTRQSKKLPLGQAFQDGETAELLRPCNNQLVFFFPFRILRELHVFWLKLF